MFCSTNSCAVSGIDTQLITVEADIRNGLPGFFLCGASNELKESKERVRVAIENAGFLIPPKRITVNIYPLGIKGPAGFLDMPVAVAVLAAYGMMPENNEDVLFAGELSLSGKFKPLPNAGLIGVFAYENGCKRLIVPKENAKEAAVFQGLKVYGADNLMQVLEILDNRGEAYLEPVNVQDISSIDEGEDTIIPDNSIKKVIIAASVLRANIMFIGGSDEEFNKLISCLEKVRLLEEGINKTKLSEYNKVIRNNSPFEILNNGMFVVHNPEKNKTKDYSYLIKKTGNRGITVSHGALCPCGYYPDKSRCKCTKSKTEAFMSKLNTELFNTKTYYAILPEKGYDSKKRPDMSNSSVIHVKDLNNEIEQIGRKIKARIEHEVDLSRDANEILEEVFKNVKYSEQLFDLIVNTGLVFAFTEGKEVPDINNLKEAVQLCTMLGKEDIHD